jgi:DNA-binding response OmpR family regulator
VTILIVEDEAYMLRLLVRFFSNHGYRVLQALDGEQATDLYRQHGNEIDAVLLDIRLPKKEGEQVFQEIKIMNPTVKVIMASGFLEAKTKIDMTVAGVKHFVDKPYVLTDVLDLVENMLSAD